MKEITVKGARIHNLKDIDITIPKNKLVVATGVSGSGKSSLMFDIIFEQGRSQYLKSLGILSGIDDDDKFDHISGLGPTIAVQQHIIRQSNPRSTVGSKTGILNLLCLLYSGEGKGMDSEERLAPSYFSHNSPNGMCFKCSGRGFYYKIHLEKLVPDNLITLREVFLNVGLTPGYERLLERKYGDYMDAPFVSLPDEVKSEVVYGQNLGSNTDKRSYCLTKIFEGHLYKQDKDVREYYGKTTCSQCEGYRVGEEARSVFIGGKHIGELGKMSIIELGRFFEGLVDDEAFSKFGDNIIKEIRDKLNSLIKVRLGYLTLYREMPSLSGGEIQRLFLTSHLDSKLDSLIYVLDEPTAGLHEAEKEGILESMIALRDLGNSVIVVEHDRGTIAQADYIVDIGPKAGEQGGEVVYQGDLEGLLSCENSITGSYLSGDGMTTREQIAIDLVRHPQIKIVHARTNNLKDITVSIPVGCLVGIAGLSGSGKSSLISDTLIPLLKASFKEKSGGGTGELEDDRSDKRDANNESDENIENNGFEENEVLDSVETIAEALVGVETISGYAEISQAPIGRNMNSNPATYIGIWDKIRKIFAEQPLAVANDFKAGHFSFNSKGACPVCGGSGNETIWLGGNLKINKTCKACHGKRYNKEVLKVKYKDKNIYDVLKMTVSEAVIFFGDKRSIISVLSVMDRIGMGYIELGQPTPTLSGGEAQRIKLAKEIGKNRKGNVLYVLDEPTTGLSLYDTSKLIELLDELVQKGNSVIVVEHDIDLLKVCDWMIELGPSGGEDGGYLIATGTPSELKNNPSSITGRYL
ncbi:excinuclease ABC subunit UvrA [Fusibacter bizertensis]